MDTNLRTYERDASHYRPTLSLEPPEQRLVDRLRDRWHTLEMLDVGVGTGRTAYTFAPLAKHYLGIDYSANMVAMSRERVRETATIHFEVADARNLRPYGAQRFDVILFSYNGLDSVGLADRVTILREIYACLKPGGLFLFSSHSLLALPFPLEWPAFTPRQPARSLYRLLRSAPHALRLHRANRALAIPALQQQGAALLRDGAHNFGLELCYVMPAFQVEQLQQIGFRVIAMYDLRGQDVTANHAPPDPWLHYLCGTASGPH